MKRDKSGKSLHEVAECDVFYPDFMGCAFVAIDQTAPAVPPLPAQSARLINPQIRGHACKMPVNRVARLRLRTFRRNLSARTGECLEALSGERAAVSQPTAKSIPAQKSSNKSDFYCGFHAPPRLRRRL